MSCPAAIRRSRRSEPEISFRPSRGSRRSTPFERQCVGDEPSAQSSASPCLPHSTLLSRRSYLCSRMFSRSLPNCEPAVSGGKSPGSRAARTLVAQQPDREGRQRWPRKTLPSCPAVVAKSVKGFREGLSAPRRESSRRLGRVLSLELHDHSRRGKHAARQQVDRANSLESPGRLWKHGV